MGKRIVQLDVREMLRAKEEPFAQIMQAISTLGETDVLQLHTTFKTEPLLKVLAKQGYRNCVVEEGQDHFMTQFYRSEVERPCFHVDNRGKEPPEPMVKALNFLDSHKECQTGEIGLQLWNDRVPALLLPELEERGYHYEVSSEEDGSARVFIYR